MTPDPSSLPERDPAFLVSNDITDAMGKLVVASGRVEFAAALALRACLDRTDEGTKIAFLESLQFRVTCVVVERALKGEAFGRLDPSLQRDWAQWSKEAQSFMKQRNSLLHGVIMNSPNGAASLSVNRRDKYREIDAAGILGVAVDGMVTSVRADAHNFAARIQDVIWDESLAVSHPLSGRRRRM
ncbi:hypothetical protein [Plantibacter cousiniae (nom. nud.)]|uniref:Apea-like HEPN domain-containing protein n=1 Tax=Plantibacter cousiniae (nom. nud.) TaxID=199709 RepID=A0ABY1LJ30_9MICO|nr:hypothetical protein [Plantibacter cousiniae]SKC47523.1 hypothetical protein SAMN06295973_1256 [Plantibacter cousiniae]